MENKKSLTYEISKIFNLILKFSIPFIILSGGIILWNYLNILDIGYVFSSVITQTSSLILITTTYLPIVFIVTMMLLIPGILLNYLIYSSVNTKRLKSHIKIWRIHLISFSLTVLELCVIILHAYLFPEFLTGIYLLLDILTGFLLAVALIGLFSRKRPNWYPGEKTFITDSKATLYGYRLIISVIAFIPALLSVIMAGYFILSNLNTDSIKAPSDYLIIVSAFIILSFSPSLILMLPRKKDFRNTEMLILTALIPIPLIMLVPNFFRLVLFIVLTITGVVDTNKFTFYISRDDAPASAFEENVWEIKQTDNAKDHQIVTGSLLFTLGDYTLICPESNAYQSGNALKSYIKINYATLFSTEEPELKTLREITAHCQLINKAAAQLVIGKVTGKTSADTAKPDTASEHHHSSGSQRP